MNLLDHIKEIINECLNELGYKLDTIIINSSARKDLGEYQFNEVMRLAKMNNLNPVELANELVEKMLKSNFFDDVNVAGPGFINMTISQEQKIKYLNELYKTKNYIKKKYNKKIIIDYGGANVAKVLHVGHLRSANIGESLKRLARALGNEVIGDVHLGDYGLQMGMILLEIENRFPDLTEDTIDSLSITNDDLIYLYPVASKKAKEDPEIMERARALTYELQNHHPFYKKLWQKILDISITDIKKIYDELNVKFELWNKESDEAKYIPEMFEYLKKQNLIEYSEGAQIISVSKSDDKKEMPPLLLIKSNKTVSYETTDLATIWGRVKNYNPDEMWYVVDKRQELHFEQTFRAARKSKMIRDDVPLYFIGFGTMNGADNKPFKTRDGGVMTLTDLLVLMEEETAKNMIDNITGIERLQSIKKIAIGTLKYADLIPHVSTNYVFDPVKFSDTNGKTAPFVMYSTIRIKSLLKKASEQKIQYETIKYLNVDENNIVLNIMNLQKVLEKSYNEKSLNEITNYLYELNNSFNQLYANNRILSEQDVNKRESWLVLANIVYDINIKLLDILAIELPERM